jgi:hypothetical protein
MCGLSQSTTVRFPPAIVVLLIRYLALAFPRLVATRRQTVTLLVLSSSVIANRVWRTSSVIPFELALSSYVNVLTTEMVKGITKLQYKATVQREHQVTTWWHPKYFGLTL